jgi:hypothetical protein
MIAKGRFPNGGTHPKGEDLTGWMLSTADLAQIAGSGAK